MSEPENLSVPVTRIVEPKPLRLSGSQPFTQQQGVYIMIGERTIVASSAKFANLVKEGKFQEAVSVARQQVENGANVLDICMDGPKHAPEISNPSCGLSWYLLFLSPQPLQQSCNAYAANLPKLAFGTAPPCNGSGCFRELKPGQIL